MLSRLCHLIVGCLVSLPYGGEGQATSACVVGVSSPQSTGQCLEMDDRLQDKTRILHLEKQMALLLEENQELHKRIEESRAAGYAAGSGSGETGGTTDFLCLPEVPQWKYAGPHVPFIGFVYGTEYQVPESGNPFNTPNIYDREMPCALCQAGGGRASQAVLPAHLECPQGWTKEYSGYMMAMYYNHLGSRSAICVDEDPEVVAGGIGSLDQNLAYLLQTKCGLLPCPAYKDKTLMCTVCTI